MVSHRRGVANIATLAGRVNQTFSPYRAYMQITCLEMEKSRRLEEHRAASERIVAINARLADIDHQKEALEQALQDAEARTKPKGHEARTGVRSSDPSSPQARASRASLKLRY